MADKIKPENVTRATGKIEASARRHLWRGIHKSKTTTIMSDLEQHDRECRARGVPDGQDTHMWRIARNELARRRGRVTHGPRRYYAPAGYQPLAYREGYVTGYQEDGA